MGITELVLVVAMGTQAQETGRPPTPITPTTLPVAPPVPNPFQPAPGDPHRDVRETHLVGAAFAPVFSPDGKAVVFASNWEDRQGKGRNFELYKVNLDGTGLERLTYTGNFNSFPHFSPDGNKLLWVSGREAAAPRQFNVFLAGYH